ncbi:hypothetical protein DM02DRAFT_664852, partial [Periconia macrospinosa]
MPLEIAEITHEADEQTLLIACLHIPQTEAVRHRPGLTSSLYLLKKAIASVWCGENVRGSQGGAEGVVDFAQQFIWERLLPRDTVTFPVGESTLDLMLDRRADIPNATNKASVTDDLLSTKPLTEEDVCKAIFAANLFKASGNDEMAAVVWQELWEILKRHIVALYQLSLETSMLLRQRKTATIATIIPPKEVGTREWREVQTYRPISLLATLDKGLEPVIVERLTYLAEEYYLPPESNFGAWKGGSTTQARTLTQERTFPAWRDNKLLSLVSFD